ncbi:hypothetical protein ACFRMN_12870 [Streptomyces sp. NPDC056835]|uniref:effector-associated constant component EACC1 n=1 Tax=Streptomyces sp. NPDC056835 TaxID=3345956 RepID=UPI0036B0B43A
MQVAIVIDGEADAESDDQPLTSLYRWLTQDPDVSRHAVISLVPEESRAGDMGGAFEVINAVVAQGIALGSLAVACATWRASRSAAPVVRLERDGVTVTVEDGSPETVTRIVDALNRPQPEARGDRTDEP